MTSKELEDIIYQIYGTTKTKEEAEALIPIPDYLVQLYNYLWKCPKCNYWLPSDYNHMKENTECCVCVGCQKNYPNFARP